MLMLYNEICPELMVFYIGQICNKQNLQCLHMGYI